MDAAFRSSSSARDANDVVVRSLTNGKKARRFAGILLGVLISVWQATPAFADHTTRNEVLSESGLDYVLVALLLLLALDLLGIFIAIILRWEGLATRGELGQEADPEDVPISGGSA
jgi:hypothetical protein